MPTEDLIEWLRQALELEIDIAVIENHLLKSNWIKDENSLHLADIDGDEEIDLLITIHFDSHYYPTWGGVGDFWVISKQGLIYRFFEHGQYFCYAHCEMLPEFNMSAPELQTSQDVTGDGIDDLLLERRRCGAHTCTQHYYFITGHFGRLENRIDTPTQRNSVSDWYKGDPEDKIVMTYAKYFNSVDKNGDSIADITIHGGGHGSVGSGIQNTRTEIWSWNGQNLQLKTIDWDASEYRAHLVWQANDAFDVQNFDLAKDIYARAKEENDLQALGPLSWNNADYERLEHDAARQFASFRLIILAIYNNNHEEALRELEWFKQHYLEYSTAKAAELFIDLAEENSLVDTCRLVDEYLEQFSTVDHRIDRTNPTSVLLMDMGYANPSLSYKDLCITPSD